MAITEMLKTVERVNRRWSLGRRRPASTTMAVLTTMFLMGFGLVALISPRARKALTRIVHEDIPGHPRAA